VKPEEIAALIGHGLENEAIDAATIAITGGLCDPMGIAKQEEPQPEASLDPARKRATSHCTAVERGNRMRTLLLVSAAACGLHLGAYAIAQAAAPLPPTWTEAPVPTAPSGTAGANSNLNAQGFYSNGPLPAPAPGSVVVRSGGSVVVYGFGTSQSGQSVTAAPPPR